VIGLRRTVVDGGALACGDLPSQTEDERRVKAERAVTAKGSWQDTSGGSSSGGSGGGDGSGGGGSGGSLPIGCLSSLCPLPALKGSKGGSDNDDVAAVAAAWALIDVSIANACAAASVMHTQRPFCPCALCWLRARPTL